MFHIKNEMDGYIYIRRSYRSSLENPTRTDAAQILFQTLKIQTEMSFQFELRGVAYWEPQKGSFQILAEKRVIPYGGGMRQSVLVGGLL